MWLSSDHRGVRVYVRGEFVAPQQWLIQVTVQSEAAAKKAAEAGYRQRTLAELWQGIMLESRVGRRRGAVSVRVVVDGDRDIASLFAADGNVGSTTPTEKLPGSRDDRAPDPVAAG